MSGQYEGIFVARGNPEDIQALKEDATLAAELDLLAGKEAVIGNFAVLVFRREYLGRPALDRLARRIARMHRRLEVAVAVWQPDGMGVGIGFRQGVEWHRLESNGSDNAPMSVRTLGSAGKAALARLAAKRAEWFTNLLSAGKLAWVLSPA